ncbi:MAG TPA: hypothetical protein PLN91_12950, partial [Rhodanobacteraceae bacterium]|nr:hypothetical protein [Rhodanobacteraceae bacterium]
MRHSTPERSVRVKSRSPPKPIGCRFDPTAESFHDSASGEGGVPVVDILHEEMHRGIARVLRHEKILEQKAEQFEKTSPCSARAAVAARLDKLGATNAAVARPGGRERAPR